MRIAANIAVVIVFAGVWMARIEAKDAKTLTEARAEWQKKRKELDEVYLDYLDKLKVAATQRGDLKEAISFQEEAERLRAEMAEAVPKTKKSLIGVWHVRYTNDTQRAYTISGNGIVSFYSSRAGRTIKSKINYKDGDAWLEFADEPGQLERLTVVNGRLFVEHWNPANPELPPHAFGGGVQAK